MLKIVAARPWILSTCTWHSLLHMVKYYTVLSDNRLS